MTNAKKIEFANFTCTFGDKLTLLDMFDEIIYPAFKERKHCRTVRESEYFFFDTRLIQLNENSQNPQVGIAGKIVKNTKLKREQIFKEGTGIVEDHDELESAPTAIFVLILNNHRLVYFKEVPGAPDLKGFKATCSKFFRIEHKKFIQQKWETNQEEIKSDNSIQRLTKSRLVEMYPYPDLRITPLTSPQELKDFVDKFSKIRLLSISLLPTNSETLDNDDFWRDLEEKDEKIDASKTTVNFVNNKNGLNSEEVYKQSRAASKLANSDLKLNGFDRFGGTLKGNNDDFSLSVEIDEEDLPKKASKAGINLMKHFYHLIASNSILIPTVSDKTIEKIDKIVGRYLP